MSAHADTRNAHTQHRNIATAFSYIFYLLPTVHTCSRCFLFDTLSFFFTLQVYSLCFPV